MLLALVFSSFYAGYHLFNLVIGEGRLYISLLFIICLQSWIFAFLGSVSYLVAILNNHFETGYWGDGKRSDVYEDKDDFSKIKSDYTHETSLDGKDSPNSSMYGKGLIAYKFGSSF